MTEVTAGGPLAGSHEGGEFSLLLDLLQEVNRGATLEEVFTLVSGTLRRIFGIDRSAIVLTQPDGSLRIASSFGLSPAYIDVARRHMTEAAGARALAERRPIYIPDATTSPDFWPLNDAAGREGFHTVLIVPFFGLKREGLAPWSGADGLAGADVEPLGYLNMYHDSPREYTGPEIVLAQALTQQAAFAVQNSRWAVETDAQQRELESRFQRRVAEAEAIDRIMLRITSSLDLLSALQSITDAAADLADASYSSIYLRDDEGRYVALAAHGLPLERLRSVVLTPDEGLLRTMCMTREPIQVADFSNAVETTSEAREEVSRTGTRATLGVPLVQGGECIGALYVSEQDTDEFPPEAVAVLRRLAAFAQVAVQNAQRFSDIEAERRRLQAYLDAIPEGVIVFSRTGRAVLVNETLKREMGIGDEIEGLTVARVGGLDPAGGRIGLRPVTFRYDPEAAFTRVVRTGKPEQGLMEMGEVEAPAGGGLEPTGGSLTPISGPRRTYEVHLSPLRAPDGGIGGVVATMRDITLPLRLEREQSRINLLAELLDLSVSLNSNLSVMGLTERVVEAAMELLGASAGTLGLLERDRLVFRRFHLPGGWIDFDVALEEGQGAPGFVWQTMEPYVSNDCETDPHVLSDVQRWIHFHRLVCVPVVDRSGTFVGTLGVYDPKVDRDFDRRDVEALQLLAHQASIAIENARLSELKDAFLSIVSHELKTPVTSIKGFTQVLQRRLPPEAQATGGRYLTIINQQADRLNALINDLLDLSRIQTGRFNFETSTVDYGQIVREVVSEMQLILPNNRIILSAPQSVAVQGNANRLRQILVNLIDNAAKHGPPEGEVEVMVEAFEGFAQTSVRDRGEGLPAHEAERIFSPYYQVRSSTSHHVRGLGLGLFISRQIVEEHGGKIWVEAADVTTFRFTVPVSDNVPEADFNPRYLS